MEPMEERSKIEREIAAALQSEKFFFYLQPKVSLLTGKVVGAEALARCRLKADYIIDPADFVPFMEKNGSIVELDFLILRMVCEHQEERIQKDMQVVPIAVNLSSLHTCRPETAQKIHAIVQKYHVPAELIEFEITETLLLEDLQAAKQLIEDLKELHYLVAVDDFGSGYNGINMLQNFQFDVLKLDKCLLAEDELVKTPNQIILPNIINMSQRLNIRIVCEGVENENQCRYLRRLGCDMAQGYYFSPPVPPEEFYQIDRNQSWNIGSWANQEKQKDTEFAFGKKFNWNVLVMYLIVLSIGMIGIHWIFYNTVWSPVVQMLRLATAGFLLLTYMMHERYKTFSEQKRYLLLEQFSDTALFEYDCSKDIIRFTPNIKKIIRVKDLVMRDFNKNIESGIIYACDIPVIREAIAAELEKTAVQIRCLGPVPGENRYFWFLIRFRYIYSPKGKLKYIIGKIEDMDQ